MPASSRSERAAVQDLVVAVFRANGAILRNGNRLVADLGLTSALWQVLDALDRAPGPVTVADAARAMGLARQSVQRSVDRLAERGLVVYEHNPAHKRAQLIGLTQHGRKTLEAVQARELVAIEQVLQRLTPDQVRTVSALLDTYTAALAPPDEKEKSP